MLFLGVLCASAVISKMTVKKCKKTLDGDLLMCYNENTWKENATERKRLRWANRRVCIARRVFLWAIQ